MRRSKLSTSLADEVVVFSQAISGRILKRMSAFLLALLAAQTSSCSSLPLMKVRCVSFPNYLHGDVWDLAWLRSKEPSWEIGPPDITTRLLNLFGVCETQQWSMVPVTLDRLLESSEVIEGFRLPHDLCQL
jgi:hypothetical protein